MRSDVRAGIDVGSNAVKCVVARMDGERIGDILYEDRKATRLGQGVQASGRLQDEAVHRTCEAIRSMVEAARNLGAERVRAAATSAMREANNPQDLIGGVQDAVGLTVEVLSGEEEARLSFLAAAEACGDEPLAFFDMGGGSTEWVLGQARTIEYRASLPVGAVRVTEHWLHGDPPSPADITAARAGVRRALRVPPSAGRHLIGTGGTLRNLVAIHAQNAGLPWRSATRLMIDEVRRQIDLFATSELDVRLRIPGLEPDRADIILGGALVVEACYALAGTDALTVTDRGLRHGLLLEG